MFIIGAKEDSEFPSKITLQTVVSIYKSMHMIENHH